MQTHFRINKLNGTNEPMAACASRQVGNNKVRHNSRLTYLDMGSPIVGYGDFYRTPKAQRCAHCEPLALAHMNKQRKAHGLAPVARIEDHLPGTVSHLMRNELAVQ